MEEAKYPRIGTKGSVPSSIYELVIYDFLALLEPPADFELERIDPQDYYITSGDAIQKTEYLSKVLWAYAGKVRKQLHKMEAPTKADKDFEKLCWEQAGAALKLINQLKVARGTAVFLETEWHEHVLICIPKNPRIKPNPTTIPNTEESQ